MRPVCKTPSSTTLATHPFADTQIPKFQKVSTKCPTKPETIKNGQKKGGAGRNTTPHFPFSLGGVGLRLGVRPKRLPLPVGFIELPCCIEAAELQECLERADQQINLQAKEYKAVGLARIQEVDHLAAEV
eukprot:3615405-Amphidinium_carterae.2